MSGSKEQHHFVSLVACCMPVSKSLFTKLCPCALGEDLQAAAAASLYHIFR
jgi:hypothetical protein